MPPKHLARGFFGRFHRKSCHVHHFAGLRDAKVGSYPRLKKTAKFVKSAVANGFFTDTIAAMNTSYIACSVISAGIGLGTLLLRRQAH
jgi:hypothetical protein